MGKSVVLSPGDLYVVTNECYSSYGVLCIIRVLKEIDLRYAKKQYMVESTPEERRSSDKYRGFIRWLVHSGGVEILDVKELWLGDHGNLKFERG